MNENKPRICDSIGMLHVPVNSILASPPSWREALALPAANGIDWIEFDALENDFCDFFHNNPFTAWQVLANSELVTEMEKRAAMFSFFPFLLDRVLTEAEIYFRHDADALMLENIAALYFVRENQPVMIVAVMSLLAKRLRETYPEKRFGIQILAFSDDLALAIALRYGFHFVRSESALFAGLRPEGPSPNQGNLSILYAMRNRWLASHPDAVLPRIFVDMRKKHTIFQPALENLDCWMENLLFQKIEGAILTGPATGKAVALEELYRFRQTIDSLDSAKARPSQKPLLLIGSGVSLENITLCRHYADSVIVGSSLNTDFHRYDNRQNITPKSKFLMTVIVVFVRSYSFESPKD